MEDAIPYKDKPRWFCGGKILNRDVIYLLIFIFGLFSNRVLVDYVGLLTNHSIGMHMLVPIDVWFKMFLNVCLISPIVEELIFRKLLLGYFKEKGLSISISLFLSTLMFSIFHFNIVQSVMVFLPGLFMGYLFWKSDKITHSILFHAVFNFSALISLFHPEMFEFKDITDILYNNSMVTIMVAILSFFGIVRSLNKKYS
jgi:membrane protease YdiL (CAAX protease family)